ncbi:unnamed protein product [Rodentolepis nana]|uniref:Sulfhydryl oxidase n=1 Tax=Rodentolepis nana TaxID=102285 RepID=A0A0R3TJJ7_RODNA|nr:unnamed protein product [Rodentolepis nana]
MSKNANNDKMTREDEEKNMYDPKSKYFCRTCVDLSTYKKLKPSSQKQSPYFLDKKECPLDKTSLGRATWALLHTIAAYYPSKPTIDEMQSMERFFYDFAKFFPCKYCADDFKRNMEKFPPKVHSREALSGWLCLQHNLVNQKIKKPLFDCSKVLERWRFGWKDRTCDLEMPFLHKISYKVKTETILDFWNGLEDHLPRSGQVKGPMERLMQYMREGREVLVVTRGMREIRALLTGKLGGFDRFWNLVLFDVNEYAPSDIPSLKSNKGPGRNRRKRLRRLRKTGMAGAVEGTSGFAVSKEEFVELMTRVSIGAGQVNPDPTEEPTSLGRSSIVHATQRSQNQKINPVTRPERMPGTSKEVATQRSDVRGYDLALQPKFTSYPALYIRGANVVYVSLYENLK